MSPHLPRKRKRANVSARSETVVTASAGGLALALSAMAGITRTLLIFGGFVVVVGAAFYPIYFRPLLHMEQYRKEQAANRSGIVQEDVQPPGLKVWSDPFGRK